MHRPDRHPCLSLRLATVLLLAHLLAVVALASSPRLHHWAHPGADDDDHDCAVVLFLHGGGSIASGPVLAPAFVGCVAAAFCRPALDGTFVPSVFASGGVLEHAPPTAP